MITPARLREIADDNDKAPWPESLDPAIDELREAADEIERLSDGLVKANEQAERFEREWYLRGDEIERLQQENANLRLAANPEYLATIPDGLPPILDYVRLEQAVTDLERLRTLFGTRFHLDAVCGSCSGPLECERDAICCRCTDADVADMESRQWKELTAELERLQAVVDRLPKLVELSAIDAIRNFLQYGHEMSERDCYPNLYKRGDKWRYHRRVAANEWADDADPIKAAEKARQSNG